MKNKKYIFILIISMAIGFITYNYIYKEHRNIAEEEVAFFDSALNFHSDFKENPKGFNEKHLDKVIKIEGKITEVDGASLALDNTVYAAFIDSLNSNITINNNIIIKGRYVGYDDLLEVLKIDQATVVDK